MTERRKGSTAIRCPLCDPDSMADQKKPEDGKPDYLDQTIAFWQPRYRPTLAVGRTYGCATSAAISPKGRFSANAALIISTTDRSVRYERPQIILEQELWISGERVITRVDSFQSTSPSSPLGRTPHAPRDLTQFSSRVDGFAFAPIRDCRKMERLDRRIGQRRDATRAPTQARSGWRPSGRLLVSQLHHLRTTEILSKRWGPPQERLGRYSQTARSTDPIVQMHQCFSFAARSLEEPRLNMPQPI